MRFQKRIEVFTQDNLKEHAEEIADNSFLDVVGINTPLSSAPVVRATSRAEFSSNPPDAAQTGTLLEEGSPSAARAPTFMCQIQNLRIIYASNLHVVESGTELHDSRVVLPNRKPRHHQNGVCRQIELGCDHVPIVGFVLDQYAGRVLPISRSLKI